jgi:chromosome partitioning protein
MNGRATKIIDTDFQASLEDWYHVRRAGSRLDGLPVIGAHRALSLPKLRELAKGAEFCVVDTPPRADAVVSATLLFATTVLTPMRIGAADWWSIAATTRAIDQADELRASIGLDPVRRCFVVTGIALRSRIGARFFEAVRGLDGDVFPDPIPNRVAYPEAFSEGESVSSMMPGSAADVEMRALYDFVTRPS